MIRSILAIALLAVAVSAQASSVAGDAAAGQHKSQPCQACHGPDGNKTLDGQYPRLAGQYADYLLKALREYKSGARQNAVMKGFADTLSDQDMADLAVYFASQPGDLTDLSHLR